MDVNLATGVLLNGDREDLRSQASTAAGWAKPSSLECFQSRSRKFTFRLLVQLVQLRQHAFERFLDLLGPEQKENRSIARSIKNGFSAAFRQLREGFFDISV